MEIEERDKMKTHLKKLFFTGRFKMFLFLSLMKNNCQHNKSKKQNRSENQIKSIHLYSPLSTIKAMIKRDIETIIPEINFDRLRRSGATKGPKTKIARTNLPISDRIFDKFSICFFVSFILNKIITESENFVNGKVGFFRMGRTVLYPVQNEKNDCNYSRKDDNISPWQYSSGLYSPLTKRNTLMFTGRSGVLFSPVLMQNYSSKDKCDQNSSTQQNVNSLHDYSPLSASNPSNKKTTNAIKPPTKISILNFSGATNCPMTSAMKIYLLKSRKTFAKFSLCRFVSSIFKNILSKIQNFVKPGFGEIKFRNLPISLLFLAFSFLILFKPTHLFAEFELLKSTDPVVRMKEAQRLGNERIKEAVPYLIDLLNDKSTGVRIAAIVSLGRLKDERAIEPLLKIVKEDKNRAVRIMAVQSLGRFRDKRVLKVLEELVDDKDERIRAGACRSLGWIGNEKVVGKLLEKAEKDENPLVRQSAIGALTELTEMKNEGKNNRKKIEALIKKAKKDKNEKVRKSAENAFKKLEEKEIKRKRK